MGNPIKEQLILTMMRVKRTSMSFPSKADIRIGDLFLLNIIKKNISCPDKMLNTNEIASKLNITKSAVSQMLNNLENKGYICREIDKNDRRKIKISLTAKGSEILTEMWDYFNKRMKLVITRFGEENTEQLVYLINLLMDVTEDIEREISEEDKK